MADRKSQNGTRRRTARPPAARARRPQDEAPLPAAGVRLLEVEEVELAIEKLVAGGEGLGRWNGIPIFVPRAAPGDRLRVRLTERRPGYGRAEIVELLQAGPGRRASPCPHFADCGGCDLQHLDDATQLRAKSEATLETLRRLSGLELPPPRRILAAEPWRYRLRTQVHLERVVDRAGAPALAVGYRARGSRRLVPVSRCPVLVPELERAVLGLGRLDPGEVPSLPSRLDLAVGEGGAVAAAPPLPGLPGGELHRRVAGFDLAYDARCFFQGHAGLLDRFVDAVVGEDEGDLAIDLYGGVGLFALPLTRRYRRVVLVESDRLAVRFARRNARQAEAGRLEVEPRSVESWIGGGLADGVDRVVADPPRDGLAPAVRSLLAGRRPRRLTYVSCHPAALARDLRELAPSHRAGFRIEALDLVDLFPQTGHMEVIVQMSSEPT